MTFETTHGLSYTKDYSRWNRITQKCYNPNDSTYAYYGARGIGMYEPWIDNPELFCEYISTLPHYGEEGMTLDRIDNNGDYGPGNLRWTNRHVQSANRSRNKVNSTGFVGVVRRGNKYMAQVKVNGKNEYLGIYDTPERAAKARNEYIKDKELIGYNIQGE